MAVRELFVKLQNSEPVSRAFAKQGALQARA